MKTIKTILIVFSAVVVAPSFGYVIGNQIADKAFSRHGGEIKCRVTCIDVNQVPFAISK